MSGLVERTKIGLIELGHLAILLWETIKSLAARRLSFSEFIYQLHFIGVKSQSVVLITGAFTGMVMAAQTYYQFHKVRMDTATLAVVSVSMCSELGPVLTGLMVAGRVGAAMAAELGTMKVTEQIDALRTLATHPTDYLVLPRFTATMLALPLLTAEAIVCGIGAGWVVCVYLLNVDATYTWAYMIKYSSVEAVLTGLVKAAFFGGLIAIVGCFKGLSCGEGAEGVGRATTAAVVWASIGLLISNFFLTLLLNELLF